MTSQTIEEHIDIILQEHHQEQILQLNEYLKVLLRLAVGPIQINEGVVASVYRDYENYCTNYKRRYLPINLLVFWRIFKEYGFKTTTYYIKEKKKKISGIRLDATKLKKMVEDFSKFNMGRTVQIMKIGEIRYFITTIVSPVDTVLSKFLKP